MDCSFGIQGKDFVLIASDCTVNRSIFKLKEVEDKIKELDSDKLLSISGEPGDRLQFGDLIEKNIHLYRYRNNVPLSTKESANFIRTQLATAIRENPVACDCLFGGYDQDGPKLYYIDYLGTLLQVHTGAHGYGSYFAYSIMDNKYKKDFELKDALETAQLVIKELQLRFLVAPKNFKIKIITKKGIEIVQ